jgi:hypothetical protein
VEVVRTFRAFLEFCYIARRSVLTEDDLDKLKDALACFHRYRSIFVTDGVCEKGISLPRQHALVHYHALIRLFGAPNGLCTSLSESKHKDSTKAVYRRSNRNNPLGQMLVANTRIDQLSAARGNYTNRGMLLDSDEVPSSHSDGISTFSISISLSDIVLLQYMLINLRLALRRSMVALFQNRTILAKLLTNQYLMKTLWKRPCAIQRCWQK